MIDPIDGLSNIVHIVDEGKHISAWPRESRIFKGQRRQPVPLERFQNEVAARNHALRKAGELPLLDEELIGLRLVPSPP